MGIRSWLYWIDRALAGDRRPLVWLGVWIFFVAALAIGNSVWT